MDRNTPLYIAGIVLLTVFTLVVGYWMGAKTQPRYHFDNGGYVNCQSNC